MTGKAAADWLGSVFAGRIPAQVGRSALVPLISRRGGVAGDFTLTRLGEEEFLAIGSGMAELYHRRFWQAVPRPDGVTVESATEALCGVNVAGPKSRELLAGLTDASLETADFPFFRSKRITVAGVPCIALRVSFTGDLGWELHCAAEDQVRLYSALLEAGAPLGIGPVGSRALMSLRLEKGYGSWGRDYSPEWWPHESGLDGLIRQGGGFLNEAEWLKRRAEPARERLHVLKVLETPLDADATGGEPIFAGGRPVGRVSSGGYGYTVGASLALAYLREVSPGDRVEVMILGRPHAAEVLAGPPFDPAGARLRA